MGPGTIITQLVKGEYYDICSPAIAAKERHGNENNYSLRMRFFPIDCRESYNIFIFYNILDIFNTDYLFGSNLTYNCKSRGPTVARFSCEINQL